MTIHGYGLAIGIGVVCAVFMADFRAKKRGMNADAVFTIALLALVFGFIGAKILYGVTDLHNILKDPLLLLTGNGFVIYGGIIGGIAAAIIYCRIKKYSFLQYFDLMAPSVTLAQGFGRIGCFLAGCCYGRETSLPWGIVFRSSLYAPNGVRLIPTQLIMSAGDFLITAVLLLYARKSRKAGRCGGLYLILYSVGRFLVEFLRGDYRGGVGPLSTSQFISIFTLVLGLLLFFTNVFSRKKTEVHNVSEQNEDEQNEDEENITEEI